METKLDQFGGRRFLLALLSGLSGTLLQWYGKLDPAGTAYGLLMLGTVAAYITGNVKQRMEELKNGPAPDSSTP